MLLPPISLNVVVPFCLEGDMSNWKHEDDILLCFCASLIVRLYEAFTIAEIVEVITQPAVQNVLLCVQNVLLCVQNVLLCVQNVLQCVQNVLQCVQNVLQCVHFLTNY